MIQGQLMVASPVVPHCILTSNTVCAGYWAQVAWVRALSAAGPQLQIVNLLRVKWQNKRYSEFANSQKFGVVFGKSNCYLSVERMQLFLVYPGSPACLSSPPSQTCHLPWSLNHIRYDFNTPVLKQSNIILTTIHGDFKPGLFTALACISPDVQKLTLRLSSH